MPARPLVRRAVCIAPIIGRDLLARFQKPLTLASGRRSILSGRVILLLILLSLPAVWLVSAVLAVAACRAAARGDLRLAASAARRGSRCEDSPAGRSEPNGSYGLAVSQGV